MEHSTMTLSSALFISLTLLVSSLVLVNGSPEDHCITVDKKNSKIVCVCNKDYCDDFEYRWPATGGEAHLISSSRAGQRFRVTKLGPAKETRSGHYWAPVVMGPTPPRPSETSIIYVDVWDKMQEILGWGGAFTDSNGLNIGSLSREVGAKIMESYFSQNGLEYNFGRVPIAGCDFSTRTYSYDDEAAKGATDFNLTHWALQEEDLKYKIPIIKQALEFTSKRNVSLNLFGSSWSPPKWMKTSASYSRGHLLSDNQTYASYANYLVRFYEAYKAQGVHFWGGTVQNEPVTANWPGYWFNSLQMDDDEMIRLISEHLGPALEAKGYTRDKFKLMVGDDNLDSIRGQVPAVMAHNGVKKYVSGLAFHWYNSGKPGVPYDSLLDTFKKVKNDIDFMLMTEACNGIGGDLPHVDLGSWERGEKYAVDIIQDLLRLANGWVDWNFCVDPEGGPNWAKDFVDSAIVVDKNKDQFYKQPMFYVLGHFSKFLKPGSLRVSTWLKGQTENSSDGKLMTVAAVTEDTNHLIVIVLNKYDNTKQVNVHYRVPANSLAKSTDKLVEFKVEPRSINTMVVKMW